MTNTGSEGDKLIAAKNKLLLDRSVSLGKYQQVHLTYQYHLQVVQCEEKHREIKGALHYTDTGRHFAN